MNNQMTTTSPTLGVTATPTGPEYIRLPAPKQRDPLFGLSRSFLNLLILPCGHNDHRPPVKSCLLRRRGARTGVRLINVDSLREYVEAHVEASYQALETTNHGGDK